MRKLRVCLPVGRAETRLRMTWPSRCLPVASRVTHQPTSHLCKLLTTVSEIMSKASRRAQHLHIQDSNWKIKNTTTVQYLPVRSLFRESGPTLVDKKHSVLFCFRSRTSDQYACAHNNRRYWRKIHAIRVASDADLHYKTHYKSDRSLLIAFQSTSLKSLHDYIQCWDDFPQGKAKIPLWCDAWQSAPDKSFETATGKFDTTIPG